MLSSHILRDNSKWWNSSSWFVFISGKGIEDNSFPQVKIEPTTIASSIRDENISTPQELHLQMQLLLSDASAMFIYFEVYIISG